MARSHFTLAALAAAAVPGFEPTGAQTLTTGNNGEFDTALVSQQGGQTYLVRVPTSMASQNDLINQTVALNAMTAGVRSRLIFEVPEVIGKAPVAKTFAVVFNFIPGNIISMRDFESNLSLAIIVGRAIGSIHQLPTGFVSEAGLASFTAAETQRQTAELVERGRASGLLPAALAQRWSDAVQDDSLWQFEPTVIHGSLGVDRFVIGEDSVAAVLGWGSLRVGDPAWDAHWLVSLDDESQAQAFESYADVRASAVDPKLHARAVLYSELELVRWLVHGLELDRQDIVDDAVAMLDRLIDTVRDEPENTVGQEPETVLTVDEVESLLESTPDIDDAESNTTAEVLMAPTQEYAPVEGAEPVPHFAGPVSDIPGFISPEAVADEAFAQDGRDGQVGDDGDRERDQLSPDDIATAPAPLLSPRVDETGHPLPERDAPRFSDES